MRNKIQEMTHSFLMTSQMSFQLLLEKSEIHFLNFLSFRRILVEKQQVFIVCITQMCIFTTTCLPRFPSDQCAQGKRFILYL
jgi:hypothetical protein